MISETAGQFGAYSLTGNSCSTYAASAMKSAGIWTPSITSPALNLAAAALRSPTVAQAVSASGECDGRRPGRNITGGAHAAKLAAGAVGAAPGIPDPAAYDTFEDFSSTVAGPYSNEFIMQQWSPSTAGRPAEPLSARTRARAGHTG